MDAKIRELLESVSQTTRIGTSGVVLSIEAMSRCRDAIRWQSSVSTRASILATEFSEEMERLSILSKDILESQRTEKVIQDGESWNSLLIEAKKFHASVNQHEELFRQFPEVLESLSKNISELEILTYQLCRFIDESTAYQEKVTSSIGKIEKN